MVQTHGQLDTVNHFIGQNVDVSPDVVIAAGAVLYAAPGNRLIIESGVCIGSGAVIQVFGGDLTLSADVSLGKEVLVLGTGVIGARACVGAESTLINPQVPENGVIAARSLLGQLSPLPSTEAPTLTEDDSLDGGRGDRASQQAISGEHPEETSGNLNGEESSLASTNIVYGRDQVMQLMKTLFPHRESLNGGSPS